MSNHKITIESLDKIIKVTSGRISNSYWIDNHNTVVDDINAMLRMVYGNGSYQFDVMDTSPANAKETFYELSAWAKNERERITQMIELPCKGFLGAIRIAEQKP